MSNVAAEFEISPKSSISIESEVNTHNTKIEYTCEINASPERVSQLENDLNFQTEEQVADSIQAESDIINARIDSEVETLNTEINKKVETITGSALIDVQRTENAVTITSKTFIHEQGIASAEWVINHNLDKYPSVSLVDSAGTIFIGEVQYNDLNTCTVLINGATKGQAYLN